MAKKYVAAVAAVLIMGLSVCPLRAASTGGPAEPKAQGPEEPAGEPISEDEEPKAPAEERKPEAEEPETAAGEPGAGAEEPETPAEGPKSGAEEPKTKREESEASAGEPKPEETGTSSGETSDTADTGKVSLQIPQKLQVIVDPFELDGKEQIYSERYTIRNTGERAGTLTLSFACRPQEENGLTVVQESDGIHEGEEKSVYLEIVFGDTERLVLSAEPSEYRAELGAGEELSLYFTGEVNENAREQWEDGDFTIEGVYRWEAAEEALTDESGGEDPEESADPDTGEADGRDSVSGNALPDDASAESGDEAPAGGDVPGEEKRPEAGESPVSGGEELPEISSGDGKPPAEDVLMD